MRISFQPADTGQRIEKWKQSDREAKVSRIGTGSSYTLDISGTVKDNEIYGGQGKTTEEVMQEAGMQDIAMTRDYMAVMSNSMSDEEFAKLQEDGYHPGDMTIDNAVTIVDQIKASLLEAGICISGYTDTLDMETLTQIAGNEALAQSISSAFAEAGVPLTEETAKEAMQAFEEAQSLDTPSEPVYQYMVENKKEPVIQDFYMAKYSSSSDGRRAGRGYYQDMNGYLAQKADDADLSRLREQIAQIIEEAGLTGEEGAEEAAGWLIEAGIPLTADTLTSYMELTKVSFPVKEQKLFSAMAEAVADGRSPKQADLTERGSMWQQAYEIWQNVRRISGEAADLTMSQKKNLTIRNLMQAQKQLDNGYQYFGREDVTARRQLEEIRLQMTVAANRELLKSGYAIETKPLEELVEALKRAEREQDQRIFGGADRKETAERAQLYEDTLHAVSEIPQMPLAAVGRIVTLSEEGEYTEDTTLRQVQTEGEALKAAYQKAGERYETFWTQPDASLGDSIRKAFQNAEVLLEELGMESSESNLRAIRILGYNHMDITEENVMTVKAVDAELGNVLRKMTPAAVLQMIREEKNPLEMTIGQLDDYLAGQEQKEEKEQEKFSKFLYKLEQRKEISEEEKESYIGIFRLIRQIEKTDGAVIGSLLNQGAELSFKNLLSAVRTYRAKPIDQRIDEEHGAVKEVFGKDRRIDEQIQSYYKSLTHKIYDALDADKLAEMTKEPDMDLEEFAEKLTAMESSEEAESAYRREQIKEIREMSGTTETEIRFLQMLEEPLTLRNLKGAEKFRQRISDAFGRIKERADRSKESAGTDFAESLRHLEEEFTDKESAADAYRKLTDTEKEILEHALYEEEGVSSLDVKELGLVYKQISFTAKLAEREQYEIPVVTDRFVTAMHLQLIHSEERKGTIELSIELPAYGLISAGVQIYHGKMSGIYLDASEAEKETVSALREELERALIQAGFSGREKEEDVSVTENEKQDAASSNELYQAAKTMIGVLRRAAERS